MGERDARIDRDELLSVYPQIPCRADGEMRGEILILRCVQLRIGV